MTGHPSIHPPIFLRTSRTFIRRPTHSFLLRTVLTQALACHAHHGVDRRVVKGIATGREALVAIDLAGTLVGVVVPIQTQIHTVLKEEVLQVLLHEAGNHLGGWVSFGFCALIGG